MEIWKKIPDFPNYQVSNTGSVKNKKGCKLSLLKSHPYGYLQVTLYTGSGLIGRKRKYVHRIVLETFNQNTDISLVVNHIDADPSNNHLENLEWVTRRQNMLHAFKLGRAKNFFTSKAREKSKKAVSKKVIRSDGRVYESMAAAGKDVFGDRSGVWRCCHQITQTYKGYSYYLL